MTSLSIETSEIETSVNLTSHRCVSENSNEFHDHAMQRVKTVLFKGIREHSEVENLISKLKTKEQILMFKN